MPVDFDKSDVNMRILRQVVQRYSNAVNLQSSSV